ncbi:hypothetical protein Tco_1257083 [Tanacetum coccineum]
MSNSATLIITNFLIIKDLQSQTKKCSPRILLALEAFSRRLLALMKKRSSQAFKTSMSTHNHETESSSRAKRQRETETVEEALLGRVHHLNLLCDGCTRDNKKDYNTVLARLISKQGGSHDDAYFRANEYWTRISKEDQLCLLRSTAHTNRSLILRVCECRLGDCWVDKEESKGNPRGESDCLWAVCDEAGKEVAEASKEDQAPEIPRFAMPSPPRPTLEDLTKRMWRMEVRQGVIERMARRQSYHSDHYVGVFEHMTGHYGVQLEGEYASLGYDEQQQQ